MHVANANIDDNVQVCSSRAQFNLYIRVGVHLRHSSVLVLHCYTDYRRTCTV